ncbi:MAG TPA: helix-turn-helix domain-containing protein [Thermoanaerobaculia bacterium]|jgi:hypothetical protein
MDPIEILTSLGLNQLEAEVYVHLLQNEPATAYRIGQALGKQTANVYKAVGVLARRGAVLLEEGQNRVCRAVPVREFIRHTERAFREKTAQAAEALAGAHTPTFDERVYRVESVDAVLERAATMLEKEAKDVAVIDVFPAAFAAIRPSIEKAVRRKVQVHLQTYEPVKIAGTALHVVAHPGQQSLEHWRSEQLNLVIDARQSLLALMSQELDRVHQAVWTESLYVSVLLHGGITAEQTIHRLLHLGVKNRALREHRFFFNSRLRGQQELLARFRGEPSK